MAYVKKADRVKCNEVELETPTPEKSEPEPEPKKKPVELYTPTGSTGKGRTGRFSFALDASGAPDLSSMRDSTKEQFRKYLTDPMLAINLGAIPPIELAPPVFNEDDVKALYVMLGPIEAYAVSLFMKVPVPLAMKVFLYTEDEVKTLTPSTVALANKYSKYMMWYAQSKEEINFAMTFFTVTSAKLQALRVEAAKLKAASESGNPAFENTIRITEAPPDASSGISAAVGEGVDRE